MLDHILGLKPNQTLSEEVLAEMFKESVQTSYQRGAEQASLTSEMSCQIVKNKIHSLKFSPEKPPQERKKIVDYLYIDADEDHVALQFHEKKGDIAKAENGGSWIQEGKKGGVCYILNGFHLEKYLLKLVSYMKKEERMEALEELHKTICEKTKANFQKLIEKQKERMPKWSNQ